MATIKEAKRELRHREWAEEIAECQSSGMKIREWCRMKGISCNTYYSRLRALRTDLLTHPEHSKPQIVPLSFAAALQHSEPEAIQSHPVPVCEKVLIRKNGIEIELPQDVSEQMLLTLMRGLREC
jgi:hypothetical protein